MNESFEPPLQQHLYVIDDDGAFRRSLSFLLEPMGWNVASFASAQEFLSVYMEDSATPAGCLLLDIRMPRMSGLELQQELLRLHCRWPIVFLTGHADVELAVQAMKQGAFDFLEKPFKNQRLIDTVSAALKKLEERENALRLTTAAQDRVTRLSPREMDVALLLAQGASNKVIARELGISDKTVHIHRQHIMEKAEVGSAVELAMLLVQAKYLDAQ